MTALDLTPHPETGHVTLDITKTDKWIDKILRNDANGIAEVRTQDGQLPSYPGDAAVSRRNHILNPSFETDAAGWTTTSGSATATRSTVHAFVGGASLEVTDEGSGSPEVQTNLTTLEPDTTYTVSVYSYAPAGVGCSIRIGGGVLQPFSTPEKFPNGGWLRHEHTFTTDGSGTLVVFYLYGPGVAGESVWWDAVQLEAGTIATEYFDGATPATDSRQYGWEGTQHASPSIEYHSGRLILEDYEAGHGDITYVVHSVDNMVSQPFETYASTSLELATPWLGVPILPQHSEPVESITVYGSDRAGRSTVHQVIDRPDPVVSLGRLGSRAGQLGVWAASYADARRIEYVADRGEIMLLRQRVAGMDMYFTATGSNIAPIQPAGEDKTRWLLTLTYTEVARPGGFLAGSLAWTFDALTAAYGSFDAVAAAYPSFDALTLNEPHDWQAG